MTSGRAPVVVRQNPPAKASYRDYEQELREDFVCSCAYCTITESEAQGFGFDIDHYDPVDHAPNLVNDFLNLLLSCRPCNRQKSNYYPTPAELVKGLYVLRPDQGHPLDHYDLRGDELVGTTKTGEFNIFQLFLNRLALQRLREQRRKLGEARGAILTGISQLLTLSLDQLPQRRKGFLLRLRRELPAEMEALTEILEAYNRSCSALLDPDPNHKARIRARREYLREHRAVNEDAIPKRRKSTKKKRRGR